MIVEVKGVHFRLTFSFVAVIVLMLIFCDESIVMMSVVSSVIHESGHLFFMIASGDKPQKVELGIFGMRIDRAFNTVLSYKKEALIALGGIIFNLFFCLVCFLFYCADKKENLLKLIVVNLLVACVNAFPVSVLDMGRAIKYILLSFFSEGKCEIISEKISYLSVILMLVFTVSYSFIYGVNISLIILTVYLYIIIFLKKWS